MDYKKYIEQGQSLIDIAIQEYGDVTALPLAVDDNNQSYDAVLMPSQEMVFRNNAPQFDQQLMGEYRRRELRVNTNALSYSGFLFDTSDANYITQKDGSKIVIICQTNP